MPTNRITLKRRLHLWLSSNNPHLYETTSTIARRIKKTIVHFARLMKNTYGAHISNVTVWGEEGGLIRMHQEEKNIRVDSKISKQQRHSSGSNNKFQLNDLYPRKQAWEKQKFITFVYMKGKKKTRVKIYYVSSFLKKDWSEFVWSFQLWLDCAG